MSPRTLTVSLLAGLLVGLSACGKPPRPLSESPSYPHATSAAASGLPSVPVPLPGMSQPLPPAGGYPGQPLPPAGGYPGQPLPPVAGYPGVPTYPPLPANTIPPATRSPTPTPSHAARCPGEPTGAQILTLIKGKPGIPNKPLKINGGPFCSGDWSFTTVELAGKTEDQLEPLIVVAFGKGAQLTLLIAGTDACTDLVQHDAPSSIRVLACGS